MLWAVPPVFLRGLRRWSKDYERDARLRFCYYVWIFHVRERRYEQALDGELEERRRTEASLS